MTEQQIIVTLATEVMRWTTRSEGSSFWLDSDGDLRPKSNWNPLQNITDAWQLVDKIGPFEYRKSPLQNGDYQHIAKFFYHGHWYSEEGATVQDAICRTVLKAYGLLPDED